MTLALVLIALPIMAAAYAYLVYPASLMLLARSRSIVAAKADAFLPMVTVVLPAYNERHQIRGALEAILAQDYPSERRHILVVSDASSDGTDDVVLEYAGSGVELLRIPSRGGKTAAENAAVHRIRGEIVVNTDCSTRLHPAAISRLVAAMADPGVGVASTRDVSIVHQAHGTNAAEAGYVGYEMAVRALETRCGGIVGASGSGYAIRAELHRTPVRHDLSRDFSAALTAHRHGLRAVSVEDAVCFVPRTASLRVEYRRKVRTISRGMDTLYFNRDLLDPQRHGSFAWKLVSHKLVRWLVPLLSVPALGGVVIVALHRPLAWALIVLALLALAATWLAVRWSDSDNSHRLFHHSLLGVIAAQVAVVHAWWRVFVGHHDHIWEPTRRTEPTSESGSQIRPAPRAPPKRFPDELFP